MVRAWVREGCGEAAARERQRGAAAGSRARSTLAATGARLRRGDSRRALSGLARVASRRHTLTEELRTAHSPSHLVLLSFFLSLSLFLTQPTSSINMKNHIHQSRSTHQSANFINHDPLNTLLPILNFSRVLLHYFLSLPHLLSKVPPFYAVNVYLTVSVIISLVELLCTLYGCVYTAMA